MACCIALMAAMLGDRYMPVCAAMHRDAAHPLHTLLMPMLLVTMVLQRMLYVLNHNVCSESARVYGVLECLRTVAVRNAVSTCAYVLRV